MFACVDVGYQGSLARAACLTFDNWSDATPSDEVVLDSGNVQPYVPGQFYQRELPYLKAIVEQLPARPEAIVIDGYVWLDDTGRKGLGGHLFESLGESTPVIGVAKTRFATAMSAVELLRGSSGRPLFVSAAGIDPHVAADCIRRMHGEHRMPTLLKRADTMSRFPKKV